jgi:hypothetical protein
MERNVISYCLALALSLAAKVQADVTVVEGKDDPREVVRMTVTPAAAPVPALRYRLMPRDLDLKPGNAAPYYYRAQLELKEAMKAIRAKFNEDKELGMWYSTGADATPIAKLPLEKVRQASQMFDSIYDNHLKPAFERNDCDWQLNLEDWRGIEIISVHLEEFQNSREIARMLALRIRLAIAERRYDDAIELMKQNYRLGHDVAHVPFLVCGLIGMAIDGITDRTLIELIGNPDSPNLYWALGELSNPPIDMRPAVRFEMDFGPRMFPLIHNAETTDHSPQEWNRLFTKMVRDLDTVSGTGEPPQPAGTSLKDLRAGLLATGIGLAGYSHAKQRLIAEGMDRGRVEKMAVGQVIAIYTERLYRRFADDWENLWQVPYAQSQTLAKQLDQKLEATQPFSGREDRELLPLVTLLLPALQATREAEVRLDREVASLRVIEALRMYAAAHDGKLPDRLEEINEVPVPNNPATGKPFVYRLENATAILKLPISDRVASGISRYEIQIASKK